MKRKIYVLLLLCWPGLLLAQNRLAGRVTDAAGGQPLAGVNVRTVPGTQGTTTDAAGYYSLSGPARELVFSSVGYQSVTEAVAGRSEINVVLATASQNLDEVVVVGYGTQRRASVTGAVVSLPQADLLKRQVSTASNLLQGLAAGVTVSQQSGRPGRDGANINIRGLGSIFSNSDPLVLIDNVPASLDMIDPNNIESISVLKDAASTAIFGSRAANGVVLITTRRGRGEGVQVAYNGFVSWQQATNLPRKVSALDHMLMYNLAKANVGGQPAFTQAQLDGFRQKGVDNFNYFDTDWEKLVLRGSGLMHSHNVNVNYGSDRVKLYAAGSFLDQDGLIVNNNYKRYDLRLTSDIMLSKRLTLQADVMHTSNVERSPGGAEPEFIIRQMLGMPATGAGKFGPGQYGDAGQSTKRNPAAQAEASGTNRRIFPTTVFRGNLIYNPFSFWRLEGMFSSNSGWVQQKRFVQNYQVYRPDLANNVLVADNLYPGQNALSESFTRTKLNNYLLQSTWYKTFGRHDVKLLAGFQAEDYLSEFIGGSRTDYPSELPYLGAGTGNINNSGGGTSRALASVFGRFNYAFDEKYLLELNGRYDGSSRFSQAAGRQWGFFPSASVGWVISREGFLKNSPWLSFAKIRASYGTLGNQNIGGDYPFASNLSNTGVAYYFANRFTPGVAQTTAGNPNITWEKSTQQNLGLDLTLWRNLSLTFDVFERRISDMLLVRPIPGYVGLAAPYVNAGSMKNNGWELMLIYRNRTGGWAYSLTANLSDVRNQVLDLGGQNLNEGLLFSTPGQPLRSYYGYIAEGLFQNADEIKAAPTHYTSTAPGDIRYRDVSGPDGRPDGKIDANDRVILGNSFPRYEYSLNLNSSWKGLDLNVFLQGVGRRQNYISGNAAWAFFAPDFISTAYTWMQDYWTPDNPGATYPRLTDANANNQQNSSFWMRDGSYLRLKNVQLGYTLPQALTRRVGSVRVYVSGQNLLTWSKFVKGFDPERTNQSAEFYPIMRTATVGLNLKF